MKRYLHPLERYPDIAPNASQTDRKNQLCHHMEQGRTSLAETCLGFCQSSRPGFPAAGFPPVFGCGARSKCKAPIWEGRERQAIC